MKTAHMLATVAKNFYWLATTCHSDFPAIGYLLLPEVGDLVIDISYEQVTADNIGYWRGQDVADERVYLIEGLDGNFMRWRDARLVRVLIDPLTKIRSHAQTS